MIEDYPSKEQESELFKAADSLLLCLTTLIRIRQQLSGLLAKKLVHYDTAWGKLPDLHDKNKSLAGQQEQAVAQLTDFYEKFPTLTVFPRLLRRLNHTLLTLTPQPEEDRLFSVQKLQQGEFGQEPLALFRYNQTLISKLIERQQALIKEKAEKQRHAAKARELSEQGLGYNNARHRYVATAKNLSKHLASRHQSQEGLEDSQNELLGYLLHKNEHVQIAIKTFEEDYKAFTKRKESIFQLDELEPFGSVKPAETPKGRDSQDAKRLRRLEQVLRLSTYNMSFHNRGSCDITATKMASSTMTGVNTMLDPTNSKEPDNSLVIHSRTSLKQDKLPSRPSYQRSQSHTDIMVLKNNIRRGLRKTSRADRQNRTELRNVLTKYFFGQGSHCRRKNLQQAHQTAVTTITFSLECSRERKRSVQQLRPKKVLHHSRMLSQQLNPSLLFLAVKDRQNLHNLSIKRGSMDYEEFTRSSELHCA